MKIRRDKRDALFSLLVRERAEWHCEACHRYFPEGDRRGLECSHFFSRRKRSVRWSPDNAAAHCFSCHQNLGENPIVFKKWIADYLGEKRLANLESRAQTIIRLKKHDLADIHANLKASFEDMAGRRKKGEWGRLEFIDPMPDYLASAA